MIIGNRFQLNNKINSGSFGEIHLAVDIKTRQTVAVKMELINCKHPQLQYEAKLLAYLTDQIDPRQNGFPRIHYYGKFDKYHVMVMDLLGLSLQELFQKCNKKFDLKTVVLIGIQIIERLKFMHKKKFIHRDIKPQNFLLGMNQHCGKVFVIDLGLSKKYIQKNGQHIPYRDDRSLKGTPRYTSLNSHLGIEQSRRDDLQSVVYMLIYFLKGQLPWQNLKQDSNYDRYQKILEKKLSVSVQNLCSGIPPQFKQLVEYTRGLHFVEDPSYQLIKNLLEQALLDSGSQLNFNDLYCWEKVESESQIHSRPIQAEVKKDFKKDSIYDSSPSYNNKNINNNNLTDSSPFNSDIQQLPKIPQNKPQKKEQSLQFNPFDTKQIGESQFAGFQGFQHKRDSIDFGDPFKAKTQQSNYEDDPFESGFKGQQQKRRKTDKNQSFDNPFGDFGNQDIVEL